MANVSCKYVGSCMCGCHCKYRWHPIARHQLCAAKVPTLLAVNIPDLWARSKCPAACIMAAQMSVAARSHLNIINRSHMASNWRWDMLLVLAALLRACKAGNAGSSRDQWEQAQHLQHKPDDNSTVDEAGLHDATLQQAMSQNYSTLQQAMSQYGSDYHCKHSSHAMQSSCVKCL